MACWSSLGRSQSARSATTRPSGAGVPGWTGRRETWAVTFGAALSERGRFWLHLVADDRADLGPDVDWVLEELPHLPRSKANRSRPWWPVSKSTSRLMSLAGAASLRAADQTAPDESR